MQVRLVDWEERLRPVLVLEGAELLEAQVSRNRQTTRFRFFLDREAGIGVDDLARLSRGIAMLLDDDPALAGNYELEVSSPGMHRVVRTEAHFRRFVGERVHIWTRDEIGGRRHFEGTILGCEGGIVRVRADETGEIEFGLAQIERAELRLDPKRPPRRQSQAAGGEAGDEVGADGE